MVRNQEAIARDAYKEKASPIVFEDEATREGGSFFDYLSIWYGPPKIGKTKLLAQVRGAYFLCTEPGYRHVKIRKSRIKNWKDFISFIKYMGKHSKKLSTVKVFVIDPVDKLAKYCMQYTCGRDKVAHPADQEWGKGWEAFRDEFTYWFLRLGALGPGIAVISHIKIREVEAEGIMRDKGCPAMPKTCYTICNDLSDITVRIGYAKKKRGKKRKRCLYTEGTIDMEAGNRLGELIPPCITYTDEAEVMKRFLAYCEGKELPTKSTKKKLKRRRIK